MPENGTVPSSAHGQMLVQGPPRIVEFQFECLDEKGAVISSVVEALLPECIPAATRDEPEPERACSNSVDAMEESTPK